MTSKTISIRLDKQDLNALDILKEYLENYYNNLPESMRRKITYTDIIKYCISKQIYEIQNEYYN